MRPLDRTDPLRDTPVVSLPNGCNSLPVELIPLLERFTKIYLWMDNDRSGQDAAEAFAHKLGKLRCVIVKPLTTTGERDPAEASIKDANDALRVTIAKAAAGTKKKSASTSTSTTTTTASSSSSSSGKSKGTGGDIIPRMLREARILAHKHLLTFADLRHQVMASFRNKHLEQSGCLTTR